MRADLALVVAASKLAASDYQLYNVYICPPNRSFQTTSHMGFYVNSRISRVIPAIRGQVESIILFESAIEKRDDLNSRQQALLIYLAQKLSAAKDYRYGKEEYKVIFLSGIGDPDTIILPHEIENNLVTKLGKKQAFTQGYRYVAVAKLLAAPKTTSSLLDKKPEVKKLANVQQESQNTEAQSNTAQTEDDSSIHNPFPLDKTIKQLLEEGYTGVDYELAADTAFAAVAHKFKDKIQWSRSKPDEDGEVGLMTTNQEDFDQLLDFMLEKFGWCPMVYSSVREPELFVFAPENKLEEAAIELTTSGEYGWQGSLYKLEYYAIDKNELCFIFSTNPADAEEQEWLLVTFNRTKNTRAWSIHDGTVEQVYYIWAEQIGIPEPNFKPTTDEILDALKDLSAPEEN